MKNIKARDLMTPDVKTVDEELTVRELTQLLQGWEISGALVTGADGRPVGVVSLSDVATANNGDGAVVPDRSSPDYFLRGWEETINAEDLSRLHIEDEGLLVRDIMTRTVYDIDADAPIEEVAKTMLSAHVHRLLVNDGGHMAGIISTFDLLRELARDGATSAS